MRQYRSRIRALLVIFFCFSLSLFFFPRFVFALSSAMPIEIIYKGQIALDVYLSPAKNAPVLLYIHGGGWSIGDKRKNDAATIPPDMVARGFTVVSTNYTLVPNGYYPRPLEDVDCALRFIVSNATTYGFNVDNISVGGSSAGGHLALLYSLNQSAYYDPACPYQVASPPIRKVISLAGPTDLTRPPTQEAYTVVANFLTGTNAYREASPLTYADRPNASQYLMLHAADDNLVLLETQALPFYYKLLAWGPSAVQGKLYTDGGHALEVHHDDVVETIANFLLGKSIASPPSLSVHCKTTLGTLYQIGQDVTWKATPSGGTGSYSYAWTGTDGLFGFERSAVKNYYLTGTKSAQVSVTSGAQTVTVACANQVEIITPPPNRPAVSTDSVSNLSADGVTLNGVANANGATYGIAWFRYGRSGTSSSCATLPISAGFVWISGNKNVPISQKLTGLIAGERYDFCAAANTPSGTVYGDISSFTTGIVGIIPPSSSIWPFSP